MSVPEHYGKPENISGPKGGISEAISKGMHKLRMGVVVHDHGKPVPEEIRKQYLE